MGYDSPIGGVTRKLNPLTVIHSTKFTIIGNINIGARAAIIRIPDTNKLVIWSSIPVGPELQNAIDLATEGEASNFEVFAAIIPNIQHTCAVEALKKQFPNVFLIGPSGIPDKPNLKLDYEFKEDQGNIVISGESVLQGLSNIDFIYLNDHKNNEVITVEKTTGTLFTADFMFNVPWNLVNEDQYPGTGHGNGFFHWSSWVVSILNPDSILGKLLFTKGLFRSTDANKKGVKTILEDVEFDTVVPCHGNIIDKNAKAEIRKVYGSYL